MVAYLIYRYGTVAASGGDYRPLLLQVPAAALMLIYPVQELLETEFKRGGLYPNAVQGKPLSEQLKFKNGVFLPLLNATGVLLTIAASIISARLHEKIEN